MFHSLQARFIAAYTICAVIFMGCLISMVYIQGRDRLFEMEIVDSMELSKLHAGIVGSGLEKNIAVLRNMAQRDQFKAGIVPYMLEELGRLMESEKRLFTNTLFVSANGTVTNAKGAATQVSDRDYYAKILNPKAAYVVSKPLKGRLSGRPLVVIGVPIVADNGTVPGGLAVAVDLGVLSEDIEKIKIKGNSYGWIADHDGNIVAHPDPAYPFNININQAEEAGFPGFDTVAQALMRNDRGYGTYFDRGLQKEKIVTYSKIPFTPGWTLFITTHEEDIFKDADVLLRNMLIAGLLVLAVFLAVIVQLTRTITRPVSRLTEAVRNSVRGDYAPLDMKVTNDEIGRLVGAYNQMAEAIAAYTGELEGLVEERTAELNGLNEQLNQTNSELKIIATRDSLTGLFNRFAMESIIEKEMSRAKRFGAPVSLIVLDIDRFKEVNDTFGHEAGDRVLKALGRRLLDICRKVDSMARWGGEEFLVLASETGTRNAVSFAEKIRRDIMLMELNIVGSVTISAGVASYRPGETFDQWFARADKSLYRAKTEGRNRVEADEQDLREDTTAKHADTLLRLKWDVSYSSGNVLIDAQHQELIENANEIIEAVLQDEDRSLVANRLDALYRQALVHFEDEEKILRNSGYDKADEHAREHDSFKVQLTDHVNRYKQGDVDDYSLLKFICREMVMGHMMEKDKEYFRYLMKKWPDSF